MNRQGTEHEDFAGERIRKTFHARWFFPGDSPPLRDVVIVVEAGRIVEIRPSRPDDIPVLPGDLAVVPILVNAHTHLEFSGLTQPIGQPGLEFTEWIRQLIQFRGTNTRQSNEDPGTNIRRGVEESLRSGVGAIGEIATSVASLAEMRRSALAGVAFLELIGLASARVDPQLERAKEFLAGRDAADPVKLGLSPHAPYTVHPRLLESVVQISHAQQVPLAMHLAETTAELELLDRGTGPFVELLTSLNAWEKTAIPGGTRPLDYLRRLAGAHRALVVHGNYLADDEIEFVGRHRDRMSVVYCPRTHAYFGHRPYPIERLAAAGARVVLGTDSRASNPDLRLWNEFQFAARRHRNVSPSIWLNAVTREAASALGLNDSFSQMNPGDAANFVVLQLPPAEHPEPWECLLDDACRPRAIILQGNVLRLEDDAPPASPLPARSTLRVLARRPLPGGEVT